MKKVFAGTFYGFDMYIECPDDQAEKVEKAWL